MTRRRAIAGLVALTATTAGGTFAFQAAYAATPYETGIGEQRRIGFQDGSSLLLDAATRVRVIATPERRRLWLARGRIDLTVAPLTTPFTIDAGAGDMTAAVGRFDLRRDRDDRVALTAIEGSAAVTTIGATRRLTGGERLRAGRVDREVRVGALEVDVDREAMLAPQPGEVGRHPGSRGARAQSFFRQKPPSHHFGAQS